MNSQQFKADAGKPMPDLLEDGFPFALRLVQSTLEYGAMKYEPHSWRNVPDALNRYQRAGKRHRQDRALDAIETSPDLSILFSSDVESGLPHIAHEIFNLLAQIELALTSHATEVGIPRRAVLDELLDRMKMPPTDHKLENAA